MRFIRLPAPLFTALLVLGLAACTALSTSLAPSQSIAPQASNSKTQETAELFESLTQNTAALRLFLRAMPKGGDLHIHLSGTPFAEEFLDWADVRAFCVETETLHIIAPPCDGRNTVSARNLMQTDPSLYDRLVDAMSVRALMTGQETGEDGHTQFFNSFDRFFEIVAIEPGKALASTRRSAADDTVLYQEIMYNPGLINRQSFNRAPSSWPGSFDTAFREMQARIPQLVSKARTEVDAAELAANILLGCEDVPTSPGCSVQTRYNCYGLRLLPEAQLFEQLGLCFALIDADPRFVGVSLVQPEDHPLALRNYDLHMQMIAYFSGKYPKAKIALHAGELTLGLVPGADLRDHIAKAVNIATSDRIGHGVGIAFESNARQTLETMSKQAIAVEVNLSSNAVILGVSGDDHPLNLYRASGVPVVLSTDDLGVLRSDMTEQYVLAHRQHGLNYVDLKNASRNSLYYAFLPGPSYWQSANFDAPVSVCGQSSDAACKSYLDNSPKAALEYKLEIAFQAFESSITEWSPNF